MIMLRILSSYTLTLTFTFFAVILWIGITVLGRLTDTVDGKLAQLSVYERDINFPFLEKQLATYKEKTGSLKIKFINETQASDTVIKYADGLRARFGAQAAMDRPAAKNGVMYLSLRFTADFTSPRAFILFLQELINSDAPVVKIISFDLFEKQGAPHSAVFNVELAQPFTGEGNGQ